MGRAGIVVDEFELRSQLMKAENSNKFGSRSELFDFVCDTEWARQRRDTLGRVAALTPPVLYQRVKQFNIDLQTPMGKRGRPNIHESANPANRKSREEKFSTDSKVKDAHAVLAGETPATYSNLVNRIKKGSAVAAIRLKCLECSNFQPKEVKYCTVTGCPLWAFRPYRQDNGIADSSCSNDD
jgi:hypothetical protein